MALKTSHLMNVDNSSGLRLTLSDLQLLYMSEERLSLLLELLSQVPSAGNRQHRLMQHEVCVFLYFNDRQVSIQMLSGLSFHKCELTSDLLASVHRFSNLVKLEIRCSQSADGNQVCSTNAVLI